MFISILVLILLFIAGLAATKFHKKFFTRWFKSLVVDNSSHAAGPGTSCRTITDKEGKIRSTYKNKDELRGVFATFDKNNDGYITKQELRESLKNIGIVMAEQEIADVVRNVDSNGDGLIDLDEFCESFAALLGREDTNKEEGTEINSGNDREEEDKEGDLKEAFDVFDGDKDGLITIEELGLVLSSLGFRQGKKLEDCKEMIRKVDMDGDGMVNFDEFKMMMKAGQRFIPVT